MSAGIDYGLGKTNINHKTGIRYGVISQHNILEAWAESAEPIYGDPSCPKCGNKAVEAEDGSDFACEACEITFHSEKAFPDEPHGYSYDKEGYELTNCLDSDVMVITSPYYTFAQFCSPCVPGAGNLNDYDDNGVKTYCLGHDWFDNNRAPYPVYSVKTNELIKE